MNRNIEIKAKVADLNSLRQKIEKLADFGPETLIQEDIFFQTPSGRLKLRTINGNASELIYYHRPDTRGPRTSEYLRVPVADAAQMREILNCLTAERGVVKKHRTLFKIGVTRIHLDRVEGLGDFLELEVALSPSETESAGTKTAHQLMETLAIQQDAIVDCAYIDLLDRQKAKPAS